MKEKCLIALLASLVFLALSASALNAVYAGESLGSGYAVTSNWHGIDVPSGSDVIVTAMTTDADVYQVTFLWKNPADHTVWNEIDNSGTVDGTYDGKTVYTFSSTHSPDEIGDWGVQALFQAPDGTTKQGIEEVIAIRATSFFVIPEAAVIGTLGTLAAMLLSFGTFAAKRKK